ncbi:MMPL family transporter [Alteromonas sp. Cnat2-8]|uniref:efflux RND transporter permease subunit n=1 Tax=Alteromonas sp. Cnat2-8 TaxID=2917728 RepID=UPI001EF57C27|nr:MMPL family transporter [Alteromonas sp. Cnat2-8]MCG7653747.1 MMPL family transporter [Alteromonas sp. Cnat2-8]
MFTAVIEKLLFLSTQKGKWVYAALLLAVVFCAYQMRLITIDTDPENMLEANHPARVFHNDVKHTFAMHDAIVVGVIASPANETATQNAALSTNKGIYTPNNLQAIDGVTQQILNTEGVIARDVMSFSTVDNITQGDDGELKFSWMMSPAPSSQEEADYIADAIARLPMLQGSLASSSHNAAAIYVPIKDKNESFRIAEDIRAYIGANTINETLQWHITGLPVAEDQFGVEMFIQMAISAPAAGLMIFILLFVFFRNFTLITAPMVVAMATVIITMGALIGLGFTVHIMSSMIAIFLMPIAVVDSVHILSEFSDRYKPGQKADQVITTVVEHLFQPMLFTSLTSAAGFYSLMLTPIPPVQIFGAFIGSGILLAFAITLTFIPAYISRMSPEALAKLQSALHADANTSSMKTTYLQRFVYGIRTLALNYKRALLVAFMVISAVSVWGIFQIQINDNPVRWFKENHEIRVADKALNKEFAGTYNAYIVIEDTRKLKSAREILLSAVLPPSLDEWRETTLDTLNNENAGNNFETLAFAVDDALFGDLDSDEYDALNRLLSSIDEIKGTSKTFQQPDNVALLSDLQNYLSTQTLVGKTQSLSDVIKVVNRELHSGNDSDYVLPNTQPAIAQTLLQYQSSHRPQDLWHFVTPDYRKTLVWLQLSSGDNQDMTKVIELVEYYFAQHPLPDGLTYQWAGKAYLNVVWQDNMVAGMLDSLLSAFIIVFVMMVLLLRSLIFGVLAMLPLTITITFIYGAIGIVGKDYDMPIAVLSALTLGLSVDFAIHFLARAKEIYKQTGNVSKTFDAMFEEPASAITRNALVIALGFTPLLLAPLVPYITVGIFLASIMFISALVTLLVLPAAMTLLKRWVFKEA